MKNDIIDVFEACVDGTLDQIDLQFEDNAAVCVVLASDGYPVSLKKALKSKALKTLKTKKDIMFSTQAQRLKVIRLLLTVDVYLG